MEFEKALNLVKEGKKVKDKEYVLFKHDDKIYYLTKKQTESDAIGLDQRPSILADGWWNSDWEIVNEKKTLSDKTFSIRDEDTFIGTMFRFSDVKEAIKEFIVAIMEKKCESGSATLRTAKEIFGDRLI